MIYPHRMRFMKIRHNPILHNRDYDASGRIILSVGRSALN